MRRVAWWLAALAVALLGWLQPATAQAFAAPQPVPVHTYDSPICDAPQDDTMSERGPPTNYGYTHHPAADDLESHGAFERSDVADHGATTTYSSNAEVTQATVAATTTSRSAQARSGGLSSPSAAMVAAKTADNFLPGLPKSAPKPLGLGSTGRIEPANLTEQLAMTSVRADPAGAVIPRVVMSDARWPAADGWVKMEQIENGVNIHYVRNTVTGAVDDFKFK